jgi:hypothetical protein
MKMFEARPFSTTRIKIEVGKKSIRQIEGKMSEDNFALNDGLVLADFDFRLGFTCLTPVLQSIHPDEILLLLLNL